MFDRSRNLESCRLIILKSSRSKHQAFECEYWRSRIDFIEIFDNFDLCLKHILEIRNESIFLIIDNEFNEILRTQSGQFPAICKIYIFDEKKKPVEEKSNMTDHSLKVSEMIKI